MMSKGIGNVWMVLFCGLVFACGEPDSPGVGVYRKGAVITQGVKLQGVKLQGVKLQGVKLQGVKLQGARLLGGDRGGRLFGVTDDGVDVPLEIISVDTDPLDGEIYLYTIHYRNPLSGMMENICEPDADGVQKAIPISGIWDDTGAKSTNTDHLTLACTSGVIAKCARWGYKPWQTRDGVGLSGIHQACTRAARADYCGDGQPHTREGTQIDIYDVLGIQTRTPGTGMLFEAAWLEDGAYCLSRQRWELLAAKLLLECPAKISLPNLLNDVLFTEDRCYIKLSRLPRTASLLGNASYLRAGSF